MGSKGFNDSLACNLQQRSHAWRQDVLPNVCPVPDTMQLPVVAFQDQSHQINLPYMRPNFMQQLATERHETSRQYAVIAAKAETAEKHVHELRELSPRTSFNFLMFFFAHNPNMNKYK
jgi:hypothetical protein